MPLNLTNSSLESNNNLDKTLIKYYLILEELFLGFVRITILKLAISQSEASSTILISLFFLSQCPDIVRNQDTELIWLRYHQLR